MSLTLNVDPSLGPFTVHVSLVKCLKSFLLTSVFNVHVWSSGGWAKGEWCGADRRVQPCSRLSVTCTAEYAAAVDACRLKKDAALFGLYRLISLPGGSRGTHMMKNVSHWQVSQSSFEDHTIRGWGFGTGCAFVMHWLEEQLLNCSIF